MLFGESVVHCYTILLLLAHPKSVTDPVKVFSSIKNSLHKQCRTSSKLLRTSVSQWSAGFDWISTKEFDINSIYGTFLKIFFKYEKVYCLVFDILFNMAFIIQITSCIQELAIIHNTHLDTMISFYRPENFTAYNTCPKCLLLISAPLIS